MTNTGNVTLHSIAVDDNKLPDVMCPETTLAPTEFETCTAIYTTTQADVDAGGITNMATASGLTPTDAAVTADDQLTVPADQHPVIALQKTADVSNFLTAGVLVTYTYTVTNKGNVTLDPVSVTDPMSGLSALDCGGVVELAPAQLETCTATYTTTQADALHGSISNTGTATGTTPTGAEVTATSTVTIPGPKPAISLAKTASVPRFSAPNTKVTYSYKVTNTGDVPLSAVGVTDNKLGTVSCPDTTLTPAQTETCTATYTTTQADVDHGSISNDATADGTAPSGAKVMATASVNLPAAQTPGLSLVKSASISTFATAGTEVTFSYLLTNTGNTTLHDLTITDPMPGLSPITCPTSTLAPGASTTCTATYAVTEADVASGKIVNIATATSTDPAGASVQSAASSVTVPEVPSSPGPEPAPAPAPPSPITPVTLPVTG